MTKIVPGHGSGGKLMNDLITHTIVEGFGRDNVQVDDSAVVDINGSRLAFTTDSFTITPLFFPGGDIGTLAVNGTVNDLAVMGAKPLYLSCSFIIEEGFALKKLGDIITSMKKEADSAGVKIITGDTKVVPRGKADALFINTTGIGTFAQPVQRRPIAAGDKIIISGTIGDHGMTIMSLRENFNFTSDLKSDCTHLNGLISEAVAAGDNAIKFMRDPTRGGVASVLNEIIDNTTLSAKVYENSLPVRKEVQAVCDILGLDPLYVANEGKVLFIVENAKAEEVLASVRSNSGGKDAMIIGEIDTAFPGNVYIVTKIGGTRYLPLVTEEQLPRIC